MAVQVLVISLEKGGMNPCLSIWVCIQDTFILTSVYAFLLETDTSK